VVKLWITNETLRAGLEPLAEVALLPAALPAQMPALLEATAKTSGPPDAILISPSWPQRPQRTLDLKHGPPVPSESDMAVLEDDAAWEEVITEGLKTPWFWLIHGLRHLERLGQGSVVVVVPRRVPPQLEGPDESTIRATLKGFVRTTAERVRGKAVRVNLLELHQGGLDPQSAQLLVWLGSPAALALSGQILTASSRGR
jgi:NAD(P)-dependent dehydrogenase (short-subunit alcohol dehydrogenase family)